jgi:hypothetical protein
MTAFMTTVSPCVREARLARQKEMGLVSPESSRRIWT